MEFQYTKVVSMIKLNITHASEVIHSVPYCNYYTGICSDSQL